MARPLAFAPARVAVVAAPAQVAVFARPGARPLRLALDRQPVGVPPQDAVDVPVGDLAVVQGPPQYA